MPARKTRAPESRHTKVVRIEVVEERVFVGDWAATRTEKRSVETRVAVGRELSSTRGAIECRRFRGRASLALADWVWSAMVVGKDNTTLAVWSPAQGGGVGMGIWTGRWEGDFSCSILGVEPD